MNILSIGDLLLDLVVRYDPRSGEADTGPEGVQLWPGGSAANFAAQAARLGAGVRFVSRVGRDRAGEMLVRSLEDEGVVASVKAIADEPSGRVLVMVDPDGHRRMWSYPGASSTLSPDDLDPSWFDGLDAFHLTGYSLLRDGPRAAALEALRLARARGSPLCTLDPNPPHLISDFGPGRFREMIAGLRFDIIFPNLEEGRLLTGKQTPEDIAVSLREISPIVALTLGVEGCLVAGEIETRGEGRGVSRDEGMGTREVAGKQVLIPNPSPLTPIRVPPAPAGRVVDATGAGDAFAAAFVIEYIRHNHDLGAAAKAGNRLAAEVVSRPGGR